ncbi:MAG: alpha/beta fold hydrolase, partial [Acidimicrobiia bacterium]
MIRKLSYGTFLIGLVFLGVVAQAGSYLLALPSPPRPESADDDHTSLSRRGQNDVGIRNVSSNEAPLALTIWYPADAGDADSPIDYSYGINMFGPDGSLALGTYRGRATAAASSDLTGGPYPMVILSHGFAISGSSYAWLAEHLASHGMVVIAPHHRESLDPSALWRATVERPADVLTVLSWVDTEVRDHGSLEGLVDNQSVAVVGHSYGGYTALAAAGARLDTADFQAATCDTAYETDDPVTFLCDAVLPRVDDMAERAGLDGVPSGLWPTVADSRVDAIVSIAGDAAVFGRSGLGEITVPVMAIGGTADVDSPFRWGTELTYEHVASSNKIEIGFEGGAHMLFAGECDSIRRVLSLVSLGFCADLAWARGRAHDLVKYYVTSFLEAEL